MLINKACSPRIPQRWITALLCFFGLVNAYAMRIILSIAITEMVVPLNETNLSVDDTCPSVDAKTTRESKTVVNEELYDWSEYTQGVILSSFYWAYTISNFMGGLIAVKMGGKHILGLGILSTAILTILTPAAVRWGGSTALIWLRVVMGFGEGVTYPALTELVAQWVPKHEQSRAGSIIFSGSSVGTIIGMTGSGIIMQHSEAGWPMVFYFFGALGCLSFLLNCVFCYNKPAESPFISEEELKYLRENLKNTHENLPPTPWGHILRSKPIWALTAIMIGNCWGFMTIVSDMPKYMASVLKFSVESNGYLSSLPHLAFWIVSVFTSIIADNFIATGRMTVEQVRMTGGTLATMGPAVFLILASYAGCNRALVIVLTTAGLGLMGCCTFSTMINVLDLAPNYGSVVMGLINGISMFSGILTPYVVGVLTPNQTLSEWHLVFWIVFVVFVLSNLVYLIWGSTELQQWNDPAFLTGQSIARDSRNNIQLKVT